MGIDLRLQRLKLRPALEHFFFIHDPDQIIHIGNHAVIGIIQLSKLYCGYRLRVRR
ncbi:hypothetical protein D3C73_797200 [compost metagenome]